VAALPLRCRHGAWRLCGASPLSGGKRLQSIGFAASGPSRCAIDPAGAGAHEDVRREWSALLAHAAMAAGDQEQELLPLRLLRN
jgi:hypothetical protein